MHRDDVLRRRRVRFVLHGVRCGFTLPELLATLTLMALLAALCFGVLGVQLQLARVTAARTLDADAVRTTTAVVGGELRRASNEDVLAVSADSLAMRAFRGFAVVCSLAVQQAVVSYRGDRLPDPVKDSAVWIGAAGAAAVVAITNVSAGAPLCALSGGGTAQTWHTQPVLPGPGVLLLFEGGSYYLTSNALRYRVGAGGRQPLTAALFADPPSFFARPDSNTIEYRLGLTSNSAFRLRGVAHITNAPPDST
jgi:prepilin-type N-terminal cleavage/methylation domain-containing protein